MTARFLGFGRRGIGARFREALALLSFVAFRPFLGVVDFFDFVAFLGGVTFFVGVFLRLGFFFAIATYRTRVLRAKHDGEK